MSVDNTSEDKQRLLRIIEKLLGVEHELDFLLQFTKSEMERLVVAIRGRSDGK